MQRDKIELSIIIPAYNETTILEDTKLKLQIVKEMDISFEIIVVAYYDNISTCKEFANALLGLGPIYTFCLTKNMGKGYNIFYGVEQARGEYILYIDADRDIDASIIRALYEKIKSGRCEMVYANKYHKASMVDRSFVRNIGSKIINGMIHRFFDIDIKDTQTGAKIYKAEILKKIAGLRRAKINGFAFEVENAILLKRIGVKACNIPVKIASQNRSSVNIKSMVRFIRDLKVLKKVYG